MKHVTNEAYARMVKENQPPSPMGKNMLWAFLVGGSICTFGQVLSTLYQNWGLDREGAGTATSATLIAITAVLTGLGIFDDIAKRAGAGTLVPITGFANAVVSPAVEFKTEGFIPGVGAKMFVIAGPVIVYGVSAGVLLGLVLCLLK